MALKGTKTGSCHSWKTEDHALSGKPGTGKSFFALNAPAPYLIDTEGGATREQYVKKLIAAKGAATLALKTERRTLAKSLTKSESWRQQSMSIRR